jgi:outer membrane protein OmpA-like peptidoglycan-associated protein
VAKLILEHPELKKIRVEGHTDNVGSAPYNKDLSERRAASVVRYLAEKGVPRARLDAAGYGFERPVASNATALGRAKNRRVEFRIVGE